MNMILEVAEGGICISVWSLQIVPHGRHIDTSWSALKHISSVLQLSHI